MLRQWVCVKNDQYWLIITVLLTSFPQLQFAFPLNTLTQLNDHRFWAPLNLKQNNRTLTELTARQLSHYTSQGAGRVGIYLACIHLQQTVLLYMPCIKHMPAEPVPQKLVVYSSKCYSYSQLYEQQKKKLQHRSYIWYICVLYIHYSLCIQYIQYHFLV